MEGLEGSLAEAATTALGGESNLEVGQQPQQQAGQQPGNAMPEGEQPAGDSPQPIYLPDGTWFPSVEKLAESKAHANNHIRQLESELAELRNGAQRQAAPDPKAQATTRIDAIAREIELEYLQDPEFQGYDQASIKQQARIDAKVQYRAEQQALSRIQQAQQEQAQMAFLNENRHVLDTPEGQAVYQRYQRGEITLNGPEDHLQATLAEIGRKAIAGGQQQTPTFSGVNGAAANVQTGQSRIFQNSGVGTANQQPQLRPEIQASLDYALSRNPNMTEADKQRIIGHGNEIDFDRLTRGAF